MKIKLTQLEFRKDPTFDPEGLIDDVYSQPFVVQFKRHWWNRWTYIIDGYTGCPMLFFGTEEDVLWKVKGML